jgi:hypothetical protein
MATRKDHQSEEIILMDAAWAASARAIGREDIGRESARVQGVAWLNTH